MAYEKSPEVARERNSASSYRPSRILGRYVGDRWARRSWRGSFSVAAEGGQSTRVAEVAIYTGTVVIDLKVVGYVVCSGDTAVQRCWIAAVGKRG